MTRIFFFLSLLTISNCLQAQIKKYTRILEPSIMTCQYECVQMVDTLGVDKNSDWMILRIGKNRSQFYSYLAFYSDSMCSDPIGRRLWGEMMIQTIRTRNYASMPRAKITSDYIYKNYPDGKITIHALLGTTNCLIEEEYAPQDWNLVDSTKTIHGYQCQLAECNFHGRSYKAWFTPEIPLNEGPWKFNGLPGLILEVYDIKNHYHFTLVGIQQKETEPVSYYNFYPNYEKIDRIKYLKMVASRTHKGVSPKIKKALNLDKPIKENKNAQGQTLAYDFMERDYH